MRVSERGREIVRIDRDGDSQMRLCVTAAAR